ncbi:MAG: hypothetical protein V7K67_01845 [Nostoc sp.]
MSNLCTNTVQNEQQNPDVETRFIRVFKDQLSTPITLIPFFCEAAYNSPPGYCRPPDALGGLQGGIIIPHFSQA